MGHQDTGRAREPCHGRADVPEPRAGRCSGVHRGSAVLRPRDTGEPRPIADGESFPGGTRAACFPSRSGGPTTSFAPSMATGLYLGRLRRIHVARPVGEALYCAPRLESPSADYTYPAWAINAMGGRPEIVDPGMFVAGKTLAATLLDLLTQPEELEKARTEFNERTGAAWEDRSGSLLCSPPISRRRSTCDGRSTCRRCAARSGGSLRPPRTRA